MRDLAISVAALLALAIIAIGVFYLSRPRTAALGFGLATPEEGPNIEWWLRLKGVRDVVLGLNVFACMAFVDARALGVVLLAETFVPVGDMLIVLAGKGSTKSALGVHGATAVVMLVVAVPLVLGVA